MKGLDHITAGRTAIRTLVVAVVLTAAIAGTGGTAAAEPIDGKGNDVLTGVGNDVLTYAFPIDNVTFVGYQTSSIEQLSPDSLSLPGAHSGLDDVFVALIWSQDMDPY